MRFGMLHLFENPIETSEDDIIHEQISLIRAAWRLCLARGTSFHRIRLLRVVEDYAFLDQLSNGRIDLGVWRG